MGIAYIDQGEIVVKKTMSRLDQMYEWYEEAEDRNSPILLHFRLATVGDTDLDNCQPLWVNERMVFTHNGTLRGYRADDNRSDTAIFRDEILVNLPDKWWNNDAVLNLLTTGIGYTNKLAFLHSDGFFLILNKSKGSMEDGVWYSNFSHRSRQAYYNRYSSEFWDKNDGEDEEKTISYADDDEEISYSKNGEEICFSGCWFGEEMVCYDCLPKGTPEESLDPLYEYIADKYCVKCGRHLSNKNTRNVAQRNSGGFNYNRKPF